MKKPKLRKCYVLREQEIKFKELRKGDIFRQDKASPEDPDDETRWGIVKEDAKPTTPRGNYRVDSLDVVIVNAINQGMVFKRR
jgi:hypothetical protein